MLIFTKEIIRKLAENGAASRIKEQDHKPVVKVFNPAGAATWLLSESDPDDPDRLFGLCDLGMGCPELGYVSRTELETVKGRFGLHMERDRFFKPNKTIGQYADEAIKARRIVA